MGASRHGCTLFVMPFNPTSVINGSADDSFSISGNGEDGYEMGWNDSQGSYGIWDNFLHVMNDLSGATAQQTLQSNAQEFQEYMYQQYNSPEALKRQFENAGLNTNLLGSTSFGTAQGSSGSPAVNAPASVASDVANAVTQGASNLADVPLKGSQSDYYSSYPSLNKVLETLYGNDAKLSQIEYDFLQDTFEWRLENEQFNAMTIRENYYYAVQRVKTAEQEYQNLLKEGMILEHDVSLHDYMAKVQQEVYNYWVEHGMPPSGDWQDKFWDSYIWNGDNVKPETAFKRYMRGFRTMENQKNESVVKSGAANGKVKVGGFEVDTATIQYCIQNGLDIMEYLKEKSDDKTSWVGKAADWLGIGGSDSSTDSSSQWTSKQIDKFHQIDDILRAVSAANPDTQMDKQYVTKVLRDEGYSWKTIGEYLEYANY